jgi:magnesium and cobalt exporter, CNNM family
MSEISVFAARRSRLHQRAEKGDRRAAAALGLAEKPNDFLSTVQVGMTAVGVLAGAFGGATIADQLAVRLRAVPALAPYGNALALGLVVVAITYLTLIFGELVPKRLALLNPERTAGLIARPMRNLSLVALPLVRLLSGSTALVLKLLGARPSGEPVITEDEIKFLIAQATRAGTFEEAEQQMVERVFRLGDRRVATLLTPRIRIVWLDLHDTPEEVARKISGSPYSRFPVGDGSLDNCVGYVQSRDLLDRSLAGQSVDVRSALRQPLIVPESTRALAVLERFKTTGTHLALVIDEYGGIEGLVTLNDMLEAIVGDMPDAGEENEPPAVQREDGSWLVDGAMSVEDFRELLHVSRLPGEERGGYHTLGGFVMATLGRVARSGDHFHSGGLRFEVVDMDGHQVDKVLVSAESPEIPD